MFTKNVQGNNIPTKIINLNIYLISSFICQHFIYCINIGELPNEMKQADAIRVHKK